MESVARLNVVQNVEANPPVQPGTIPVIVRRDNKKRRCRKDSERPVPALIRVRTAKSSNVGFRFFRLPSDVHTRDGRRS